MGVTNQRHAIDDDHGGGGLRSALGRRLRGAIPTAWWRRSSQSPPLSPWALSSPGSDGPDSPRPLERKLSAVAILEAFRHGPETQSEWNLLLWRVTFPMIPLVLFTALAVLGKCGHLIYSLTVCPVWYIAHFVLVAHPFAVVFEFEPRVERRLRRYLWRVLGLAGLAISLLEWYLAAPPDLWARGTTHAVSGSLRARFQHHAWIVGNTVFGLIVVVAIPRFFYLQNRRPAREPTSDDALPSLETVTTTATTTTATQSVILTPQSPASPADRHEPVEERGYSSNDDEAIDRRSRRHQPTGANSASAASHHPTLNVRTFPSVHISATSMARRRSRLLTLCAVCAGLVWLAMISSYSSNRTIAANSRHWFTLYLLSPVACVVLVFVLRHTAPSLAQGSSFEFVVTYSILLVHLPVFLGHLCFHLFTLAEQADGGRSSVIDDHEGSSDTAAVTGFSATTSWMKLGISILFLLLMQVYFYVMTQIVNAMSEPFAHPSLLYLGQLYYYLFWYVLVGSDTPIDALYWGMLLVNNVHIAFLNTGIYADVKHTSSSCYLSFAPFWHRKLAGSMATCFRATTMTIINASATNPSAARFLRSATHQRSSFGADEFGSGRSSSEDPDTVETALLGTAAQGPTDESERRVSEGTIQRAHRRSVAPSSIEEIIVDSSEPEEKVHSSPGRQRRSTALSNFASSATSLLPFRRTESSATIHFSPSECVRKCSEVGSEMMATQRRRLGNETSDSSGNQTQTTHSRSLGTEHLRPLYFLMKLAEQDNMADTTALILVPSLLTLLAVLEKPAHGFAVIFDQMNLWLRCVCMFIGRLGGSYLAREIFTYKLRSRLRQYAHRRGLTRQSSEGVDDMLHSIDGLSTRLWIQKLMLQDFHRQFWYLTVVTIVVTFACFERAELPARFALLL